MAEKLTRQQYGERVALVRQTKNALHVVYDIIDGLVSDSSYGDERDKREQRVNYEIVNPIKMARDYLIDRLEAAEAAEKTPRYRPIKRHRAKKEAQRQMALMPSQTLEDMRSYALNAAHPNTYEPNLGSSFFLLHHKLSHNRGYNQDNEDLAPALRAWEAAKLYWLLPQVKPVKHLTFTEFLNGFRFEKTGARA